MAEETQTDAQEEVAVGAPETTEETPSAAAETDTATEAPEAEQPETAEASEPEMPAADMSVATADGGAETTDEKRGKRAQKVGTVASDKMMKTCVVRVDRLIKHPKYRRYVRRTSKFMAHNDLGATVGDRVLIIETRPLSARKRWRVAEIIQKAAK